MNNKNNKNNPQAIMMIVMIIHNSTCLKNLLTVTTTMMTTNNSKAIHLNKNNLNSMVKIISSNHHLSIISNLICNLLIRIPSLWLKSTVQSINPHLTNRNILSLKIKAMLTTHYHCIPLKLPTKTFLGY